MTTENNKIIAEFMGYKKNTPSKDFFQHPTEKKQIRQNRVFVL